MADYNTVKIGTVYLTDDGLVTGMACRCEVSGLQALKPTKTGAMQIAADGTPYGFYTDNLGKGAELRVKPYSITKAVFDSVVTAINAALTAGSTINVVFTNGDTGNFDVDCLPMLPVPVSFPGSFASGRIDGVEFVFLVSEVN